MKLSNTYERVEGRKIAEPLIKDLPTLTVPFLGVWESKTNKGNPPMTLDFIKDQ